MNLQELNQKIEECERDIKNSQCKLNELKNELKIEKENLNKEWIAAVNYYSFGYPARLILNLSAIDKQSLRRALDCNDIWISFCPSGDFGADGGRNNALTYYGGETKIIFGE